MLWCTIYTLSLWCRFVIGIKEDRLTAHRYTWSRYETLPVIITCPVWLLGSADPFLPFCFGSDRAMLNLFPRSIFLFFATAAARWASSEKSTYASPYKVHRWMFKHQDMHQHVKNKLDFLFLFFWKNRKKQEPTFQPNHHIIFP